MQFPSSLFANALDHSSTTLKTFFTSFFFFLPFLEILLLCSVQSVGAQGTLSTIPRTIPVVHRSPYFGVWATTEDTSVDPTVAGTGVMSWGWRSLNWTGYVRVDGQIYQWLGNETGVTPARTSNTYLTATRTMFRMEAGPISLNVSFLSPVEPTNLVRQSFPFAYVYVDVNANDGQPHSVQLYTDVSASMVSTRNDTMEWNTTRTSTSIYHDIRRRSGLALDMYDVAENANLFYATLEGGGVTRQTGPFSEVRQAFTSNGVLSNSEDTAFRNALVATPVLAFAVDLGTVQSTSSPVVWAIGHVRENLLTAYGGSFGSERRASYFWSQYDSGIGAAIDAFLADFSDAKTRAEQLDEKLKEEASAVSTEYADLVSLSLRQTMGSIEITLPQRPSTRSSWNTSDIQAFMRDNGVSKRANPVEVIYAAMPALLYLNPSILFYLLKPLLNFQSSQRYQNAYASPDLGSDYTSATGNNTNTKPLGVEHSGNMLIMAAAYGMQTKDWASLNPYARLFKTWADFLVAESLHTKQQMSADGLTSENQSNLALKGILGVYAMSKIREALGANGEEKYFSDQAISLAKQWEQLAVVDDHISSVYGQPSTWGLTYNVFAAQLIAPDLFTKKIFRDQSDFYDKQAASAAPNGLPYDTADPHVVKTHWTMFTAASATTPATRDKLINFIHFRTFRKATAAQFSTTYSADTGATLPLGGRSSPAQGAMFALLASETFNGGSSSSQFSASRNIGGIVGGVIGGLAAIILFSIGGFFFWRRRKSNQEAKRKVEIDGNYSPTTSFSAPERQTYTYASTRNPTASAYTHIPSELVPTPFTGLVSGEDHSNDNAILPTTNSGGNPSPPVSGKLARYVVANPPQAPLTSPSLRSDGSSSGAQDHLSYLPPPSGTSSTQNLQQEVEDLRREVTFLRAQQQQQTTSLLPPRPPATPMSFGSPPSEPPPLYTSS